MTPIIEQPEVSEPLKIDDLLDMMPPDEISDLIL
jgi:hypothetical protein